ncbi:MAG: tRNA (adenosine(37)-N6)-threonylcarbamoyltransferase complex dimerization subunit type 1 TsaB [Chloroflexota bacterium]|nr:MAG: tRNA (adenosine(37)-N6)-threonylcarbamoyltransferase complex dimerization subunit type 1 TsaB [Chloroflexota bacterium]
MLLAIDTSTHVSSIALYDERGVVVETTWQSHENHTRSLMPEVVRLMQVVGTNANDLRAIGVATGPGSFTGLRIGLSAAKGLAYSLSIALLGVPTLDISASAGIAGTPLTCAILQAGRGRFGAALYKNENGNARRAGDYFFGSPTQLVLQLREQLGHNSVFVIGEMDDALRDLFRAEFSAQLQLGTDALNVRRAGFLAALAWRRWCQGEQDDLQSLAPYYIPTASIA